MSELIWISIGVLMAVLALLMFSSTRRTKQWNTGSRARQENELTALFDGSEQVHADLDRTDLTYQEIVRLAWQHGYVLHERVRDRVRDVLVFTYVGAAAPMPACLPESPEHHTWLGTPEAHETGGNASQSLLMLFGVVLAVVVVLAIAVT